MKKGDTLYSIAKKFGTTVENLKDINNLSSNTLSIGQELLVTDTLKEGDNYIVQAGDTLYNIAKKYNTTVSAIMDLNNLNSNVLSIGQQLKIPTEVGVNQYVVKAGDSLYAIARRYNTTVDAIKIANNLQSNILSIGQVLIIPN